MKRRLWVALAAATVVCGLVGVSQASAATEFGSGCGATGYFRGGEISTGHGAGSPLPVAAPTSGVITEWKVNVGPLNSEAEEGFGPEGLPAGFYTQLFVVQPAGTNQFNIVGKAESGLLSRNTVNNFPARIPVKAGDLLGLAGSYTPYCQTNDPVDATADFTGVPPIGSTPTTKPFKGYQVPVTAKIEPDVDGDGYGDETQDKCPQSAAYHEACPTVTIGSQPSIGAKAVNLAVTTSLTTPVTVSATVALGKGKTAKLTAAGQTVSAGNLVTFNLALTPAVTKALSTLNKSKALTVTITASAANITGAPSTSVTKAKLRGHGPGVPKKHPAPKK